MGQGQYKPLGALSGKIGSNQTSWLEIIDAGLVSSSITLRTGDPIIHCQSHWEKKQRDRGGITATSS